MKRSLLCFLAALLLQTPCDAKVAKLSPPDRKVLENFFDFRQINNVGSLPPAIITWCADRNDRFANPDQKWEATDVSMDEGLPRKRLIWAVTRGDYYVVHYEAGGRGHSYHVLVAICQPKESHPIVVWHGIGDQLKDFTAFLAALNGNKLDDRLAYAH
jgi:hypothetical protein